MMESDRAGYIKVIATGIVQGSELGTFAMLRSSKDGKYGTPGGHVDPFEDYRDAVARELSEELGIEVLVDESPTGIYLCKSARGNSVQTVAYGVRVVEGEPRILELDKHNDLKFMNLHDVREFHRLDKLRSSASLRMIEDFLVRRKLPKDTIRKLD